MNIIQESVQSILDAWPSIVDDCEKVLCSELQYQAMIYHQLRLKGQIPLTQLGMNVPFRIKNPCTDFFQRKIVDRQSKKSAYDINNDVTPTPDIVIFGPELQGVWNRKNSDRAMDAIVASIEVKVSERTKSRLCKKELFRDIDKLAAVRTEVQNRGRDFLPILMIIETAPDPKGRMSEEIFFAYTEHAHRKRVFVMHLSKTPAHNFNTLADYPLLPEVL